VALDRSPLERKIYVQTLLHQRNVCDRTRVNEFFSSVFEKTGIIKVAVNSNVATHLHHDPRVGHLAAAAGQSALC
jgi:hypothetical protein